MHYAKTKNMQLSETKLIRFFNSRSTRNIVNTQERGGNPGAEKATYFVEAAFVSTPVSVVGDFRAPPPDSGAIGIL
jgi:hypothetical protein